MVFGLALSIGSLTLVSHPPDNTISLLNDVGSFGFSFIILISIWLRYTRIMSVFPLESGRVLRLNIVLLFLVSLEPFLFNIITRPPVAADPQLYANVTSSLYAADLGAMFLILGFFTFTLADEEKKLVPAEMIKQFRKEGFHWLVGSSFFFVSIFPPFYAISVGPLGPVRYYLWLLPIIYAWGRRWASRTHANATASAPPSAEGAPEVGLPFSGGACPYLPEYRSPLLRP